MRDLLSRTIRIVKRNARAALAAAALAFSLGASFGQAAEGSAHSCARHTFVVSLGTRAVTLAPGSTARLRVAIRRYRFHRRVRFVVLGKLPRGISARFAPRRTRGKSTVLILRASNRVVAGRYRLRLRAASGRIRRTVSLTLNLGNRAATGQASSGQLPPFSITGAAANLLEPGATQPIAVLITNPNHLPLSITGLDVAIGSVTAPRATAMLPCTQADFTIQPYAGSLPLTVPPDSSRSLLALGVPSGQWPAVGLADLATNQDGCQGASLSFIYKAEARLG